MRVDCEAVIGVEPYDCAWPLQWVQGNVPVHFRNISDTRDKISKELGLPWQLEKDISWNTTVTFTGLDWDLERKTVGLTTAKREKYLRAIESWEMPDLSRKNRKSLEDVQKLYGKLLHASLVIHLWSPSQTKTVTKNVEITYT